MTTSHIGSMLGGMTETERVKVTLPKAVAESLRQRVESGAAESASGYVAEVLTDRFRDENLDEFLRDMAEVGGPVDGEARGRVADLMRLARGL